MLRMVPWYRWFGLLLEDFFTGTAYGVRLEEELLLKRQFLDVLILRWGDGPEPKSLPDGLEGLGEYNGAQVSSTTSRPSRLSCNCCCSPSAVSGAVSPSECPSNSSHGISRDRTNHGFCGSS